jgi:hypothetical protein
MVVTSYKQYLICCVQKSSVLNVIVDLNQKFTFGWSLIQVSTEKLHFLKNIKSALSLYFVRIAAMSNDWKFLLVFFGLISKFAGLIYFCVFFCAITCRNACNRVDQNQTNCSINHIKFMILVNSN